MCPSTKSTPWSAQSPYSASKIAADQLAISYHRSFRLGVKLVRPFNTYGPRQSARAVIPTIITQILKGRRELCLGNVDPTRDLTYVTDTALGFISLFRARTCMERLRISETMKKFLSAGSPALIAELMNVEIEIIGQEERKRPDASEVMRLRCDNSKILQRTDWRPATSLREGLAETIEWVAANQDLYKAEVYNV